MQRGKVLAKADLLMLSAPDLQRAGFTGIMRLSAGGARLCDDDIAIGQSVQICYDWGRARSLPMPKMGRAVILAHRSALRQ
jgi:hypothetical protein